MKIAIWGLGVSGLGALKYLGQENQHELFVINQGDISSWYEKLELSSYIEKSRCFEQKDLKNLPRPDLIILSPGIDQRIPELKAFSDVRKICDIEYVSSFIQKPIIAITGTNGKTTTVTMIEEALEHAGKRVFLGGNIGYSPFEAMDNLEEYDYFVFEMSSFQLELIEKFKPSFAAILNISPSHMERYDSFKNYVRAKLNISNNQSDEDLILLSHSLMDLDTKAEKLEIKPLENYDFSQAKIIGDHMRENFFVVEQVLEFFEISNASKIMQEFINSFSGVRYRLQYLGTLRGVDFYNDAKSTNTESTISALKSFGRKNVALLLGGKLRDESQDFVPGLKSVECEVSLFLFGESRDFLRDQLEDSFRVFVKERLDDLIEYIVFSEYDVVLFSPGFPSFDQYKNYKERGDHFERIIEDLF